MVATPKPNKAASNAAEGSGDAGAGGAGCGSAAEASLAVDVVPVDVAPPLDESIRATASCTLPADLVVAVAVSAAMEADSPLESVLRRLAVTFEVVASRWVELARPVPPVDLQGAHFGTPRAFQGQTGVTF